MTDALTVKYKGASPPTYQTLNAAGCDVTSSEEVVIPAGSWRLVPTGLFIEIPQGYECQIRSRSGLAAKNGVFVLNGVGTIDSDYRGEIRVILANMSPQDFIVKKGDRIAQMVFSPVFQATFEKTSELSETVRGDGGFGSTGV